MEEIFRSKPALHRYPGSMAKRTHALAQFLVDNYDGRAENVWAGIESGRSCWTGSRSFPASGSTSSRIFVGLLGKRLEVRPPGWEDVAADWPSIADVDSFERVAEIREKKREMKAKAKSTRAKA